MNAKPVAPYLRVIAAAMLLAVALYFAIRNDLASDFGVSTRALDGSMAFLAVIMAVWLARESGSKEV